MAVAAKFRFSTLLNAANEDRSIRPSPSGIQALIDAVHTAQSEVESKARSLLEAIDHLATRQGALKTALDAADLGMRHDIEEISPEAVVLAARTE